MKSKFLSCMFIISENIKEQTGKENKKEEGNDGTCIFTW